MKLRRLFLILGTVLLLGVMVSAGDYSDVADTHWASGQIAYRAKLPVTRTAPSARTRLSHAQNLCRFWRVSLSRTNSKMRPATRGGSLRSASVRQTIF